MAHAIYYIDVFTEKLGFGNPVAVVLGADDLKTEEMQRIASWTNLSETTFICAPENPAADYKLRIFTPKSELPFAGHPTIGSCYAAIKAGIVQGGKVIQECGVGLVEISVTDIIEFALPKAVFTPLNSIEIAELSDILGAKIAAGAAIVNVGPKWIIAHLEGAKEVLACQPDFMRMKIFEKSLGATGVTIFGKYDDGEALLEVRSFAPSDGVEEDPVCGSGNGAVCAYMLENGIISKGEDYIATQGSAIGRGGKIYARSDENGQIFIGGKCALGIKGEIAL